MIGARWRLTLLGIALLGVALVAGAGCKGTSDPASGGAGTTADRTATTAAPASPCRTGPLLVPDCGTLWGTYPFDEHDDADVATAAAEREAGRAFDVIHQYHDFSGDGDNGRFPTRAERRLIESGHILHFGWSSSRYGRTPDHVPWIDIASGRHDDLIDAQAQRLVDMEQANPGYRYFLDFDHEPEGRHDSGTPQDYVAAARRVHDRLRAAGVERAVWVFVIENDADEAAPFYPGDEYADWIGYDPYNWVRCDSHREGWRTFAQTVSPTYVALTSATWHAPKPLMLAEYGTIEGTNADDKGEWLAAIPAALADLPQLRAVEYFDNGVQTPGCNWALDSSPSSRDGFRQAGAALPPIRTR